MLPQKHVVVVRKWNKHLAGGVVTALRHLPLHNKGLISRTACFDAEQAKVKNGLFYCICGKARSHAAVM